MNEQKNNTVGIVVAVIAVLVALAAAGVVLYQRRGATVFDQSATLTGDRASFEFALPGHSGSYRFFLVVKTHYTNDFHHNFRVEVISPSGQHTEKRFEELEQVLEPTNLSANRSMDHMLFDLPAEPGTYRLTLRLENKEGKASIQNVRVYVKELSF